MARRCIRMVVLAGMMAFATLGMGAATAQDAASVSHPSHIHAGTCAELDPNPTYPLNDVAAPAPDAPGNGVLAGETTIDAPLGDLLISPFAINVHASAEDIGTYIACGNLEGPVVDGTLIVAMRAQNDSGLSGVAVLTSGSNNGQTLVTVYLATTNDAAASATPQDTATPATGDHAMHQAPADEAAISILDFSFDAATVEVPVGTTITWTNDGDIMHTATSVDKLWDSGIMNHGDTFSYTFTEPGSFDYLCSLHPNMVGTIVVTDA